MRYTIKRRRVSNRRVSGKRASIRNKKPSRRHNQHKIKRILRGGEHKEGIIKQCIEGKHDCYFIYNGDLDGKTKFHGEGELDVYYATDGKKGKLIDNYKGNFLNGKEHGAGTSTTQDRIFIGAWVKGKRHGPGIQMHNPKSKRHDIVNYKIDGIWEDDKLISGKYTINFHDETRTTYDGEINGDNKTYHGNGKCSWYDSDGRLVKTYDGNWDNGKMHGRGKMTTYQADDTETTQEGIWANNVFSPLQTATTSKMVPLQSSPPLLRPPPTSKISSMQREN